ncbi:MAG: long-chain-acyl-CoA synthetase [Caulobacterales bacterium]
MADDALESLTRAAPPRVSANRDWLRALEMTAPIEAAPTRLFPTVIDELAEQFGDRPALLSDDETLSFRGLAERSRRYARWALDQGLGKGDVVALLMPNRPEYLAIWLGLTRIGVVVALINTSLAGPSLAHSLAVAAPRRLIVDAELEEQLEDLATPPVWLHGAGVRPLRRLDLAVERYSAGPLPDDGRPTVTLDDRALMIYTSGTTGLPKAAYVSHHRVMTWTHWFSGLMDAGPGDRLYNCLPMFHSVGGIVATGAVLVRGGSVVIKRRFSQRQFWDDIAAWDCTLFQYIGELCRYLLAAPPRSLERAHRLRLICGNGLAGDVWTRFQERFAIPRILEFYAATEGSFSLYNVEGRPGAIGRVPPFLAHRFGVAIAQFDPESGAPARDADGFCLHCARGEVGEAIGRISAPSAASVAGRFEGYSDDAESRRKVLRDVFEPGDAWFRTGDLMRQDQQGFFYFVDRIGDTFRWKGENVATTEVEEALSAHPGVTWASVYGVTVPGAEGRAGMAAIVAGRTLDLASLWTHLDERLPSYARPRFLRIVREVAITETFKPRRQALAGEGYDPARVRGQLYYADPAAGAYVPLDKALFARLEAGEVRL